MLKNGSILGQPKDIKLSKERRIEIFKGMGKRLSSHVGPISEVKHFSLVIW